MLINIISLVTYLPVLTMNHIELVSVNNNRTDYRLKKTEFGKSNAAKIYLIVLNSFRISLVIVVLSVLNWIAIYKFCAYLKRKVGMKALNSNSFYSNALNRN